ncbi:MAG: folate-sensitive fragile site protein Fra10Ac1-domain-containing protein [Olpidium bornovanus]|uniref:Folate-sensitive fragile site protein Fra10Ac1-domain-containing protein n=1 Tax=Olpidium bornovanus TaxID=278681 RepID=A0A8H7ZTF0_9FUNG|nr:MAG: folate-sensitive fragile site protein Fra10Ac1-domain-containing protein [Olpidium bornovanus]
MAALRPARPPPSVRARRFAAAGDDAVPEAPPSAAELHSRKVFRNELNGLGAWTRHKYFVDTYLRVYGGAEKLAERQREAEKEYITDPDEDENQLTWEQRVAKKYYGRLFKEYCIAELKRYDEGKGQFVCGALRCEEEEDLKSWEVNFAYSEGGERKNALVKLRLCPDCSAKLHHSREEKDFSAAGEESRRRHRKKEKRKRTRLPARREASSGGESSSEDDDRRHRRRRHNSRRPPEHGDDVGGRGTGADDGSPRRAPFLGSESSSKKDDRHCRRRRRKSGRQLGRGDDVASDGTGGENGLLSRAPFSDGELSSEEDDRRHRRRRRNSDRRPERGGDTRGDRTGGGKGSPGRAPSSAGESSSLSPAQKEDRSHWRMRRKSGRRSERGGDTGGGRTDGEDGSLKKHRRRTASGVSEGGGQWRQAHVAGWSPATIPAAAESEPDRRKAVPEGDLGGRRPLLCRPVQIAPKPVPHLPPSLCLS